MVAFPLYPNKRRRKRKKRIFMKEDVDTRKKKMKNHNP